MFILFAPMSGKFSGKAIPKFVNEVNKMNNTIKNLKGKGPSDSNLASLMKCLQTMKVGNSSMKVGTSMIASLIKDKSILNRESHQDLMTISYNNSYASPSQENYLYTNVKIGTKHSSQVLKYKNGPSYSIGHRKLLDTVNDCRSTKERGELKLKHGANQRYFSFLESSTCLTIDDIELLSKYDEQKDRLESSFNKIKENIIKRNQSKVATKRAKTKTKDPEEAKPKDDKKLKVEKKLRYRSNSHKFVRNWAGLLKNRTEITISNRLEALTSAVTIHLLQYSKSSIYKNNCNISDLLKNCEYKVVRKTGKIVNENEIYLEKLHSDDIIEKTANNYITRLVTPLDVNLTQLECFKEHCRVVDSWSQELKPNAVWKFKLTKSYKNGVYLNKLHELKNQNIDGETPVNYFFLIESFGKKEASIRRNSDMEVFSGVHSPSYHHVEIECSIDYICDSDEQDYITVFKEIFKSKEFESEELALNYYPNREEGLNINFDDIQFTPGKKKKYSMDVKGKSKEAEMQYFTDTILESMGRLSSISGEKINLHDVPYIVQEDNIEDEETHGEAPYDESEHH